MQKGDKEKQAGRKEETAQGLVKKKIITKKRVKLSSGPRQTNQAPSNNSKIRADID